MSDAVHDILTEWRLPVWLTVSIVITAVVYLRGWWKIRETRAAQFTGVRGLRLARRWMVLLTHC
jgi:putative membrane protein